jgi:hypothetical protein
MRSAELVVASRAGQISTEHLKTSIQHVFVTCRLPRLHKFRRCYRNRHTFFGPSETIGVYISKSYFFKSENCDHKKRYRKKIKSVDVLVSIFSFFLPPPSTLRGKMKRFRAQIESKDAAHPHPGAISGAKWTVRPTESDLLSPTHPPLPTLPRLHKFRRCYRNRHTFFWTAGNNRYLYLNHFFLRKISII